MKALEGFLQLEVSLIILMKTVFILCPHVIFFPVYSSENPCVPGFPLLKWILELLMSVLGV